ncbi:MAG: biotin-dependent carboxyltransferase family protein, partial [bacterium]
MTTLQDLGRPRARAFGVTTGGAMDQFALIAGNRLVGNPPNAAALELTLMGPSLVARAETLIAITGADLGAQINGEAVPLWTSTSLHAGDVLTFASRRRGIRAYVAVAGGFEGDQWLDSRSTDLLVGRGGFEGRTLISGDVLRVSNPTSRGVPGRHLGHPHRQGYG